MATSDLPSGPQHPRPLPSSGSEAPTPGNRPVQAEKQEDSPNPETLTLLLSPNWKDHFPTSTCSVQMCSSKAVEGGAFCNLLGSFFL